MRPPLLWLQLLYLSAAAAASLCLGDCLHARSVGSSSTLGLPVVARGNVAAPGPSEASWALSAASTLKRGVVSRPLVPAFGVWRQWQQPARWTRRQLRPQQHQRLHYNRPPLNGIWQHQPSQGRRQTLSDGMRNPLLQRRSSGQTAGVRVRPSPLSAVGSLQMNAIPRGSVLEQQMNDLMQDPIKNMPWDIYVPFYKQYGRGTDNNWLHFLQGNWTFIEAKTFAEKPASLMEALRPTKAKAPVCPSTLCLLTDSMQSSGLSTTPMELASEKPSINPTTFDSIGCLMATKMSTSVSHPLMLSAAAAAAAVAAACCLLLLLFSSRLLHLLGDSSVKCCCCNRPSGETDAELEARLWGSWDDPQGLHEYLPETGWRDTLPDEDITGMPRPWTHKQSDVLEFPPHHRDPSPGPPDIPLEVELAAAGMWRGYVLEPGWTRHAEAIAECNKAQQWKREEAEAPTSKPLSRKTKSATTAKKQEKQRTAELLRRTQDIVKAHWADIRKHPVYVRAVVEGATHAAAAAAAAAATPRTAAELAMGKDITEGLEMQETLDPLVQGEVNPPNAEGKTLAVNLALYSLSPFSCSVRGFVAGRWWSSSSCCCCFCCCSNYLSPRASVAEHEEMYHYLMTENHREGRYTDFHLEIAAAQDIEYRLRHRRQGFPRLMALYRPLWAKRKYGEEFGEPPKEEEEDAHDEVFTNPAVSLHWSPPGSRSSSSSSLLPPLSLPSTTPEKGAQTKGRSRHTRSV
ncbi:hypothetical protein Emed_001799 [Eimeria media]